MHESGKVHLIVLMNECRNHHICRPERVEGTLKSSFKSKVEMLKTARKLLPKAVTGDAN